MIGPNWTSGPSTRSECPSRVAGTATRGARSPPRKTDAAAEAGRYEIYGPTPEKPTVEAWADDYIHFERRPPWQGQLRNKVRSGCAALSPSPGQVLHATFHGQKPPNADVENLALYNIGSFTESGTHGIRFELSDSVPTAPGGTEYRFAYRYALVPGAGSFDHWQRKRTLAAFDWTDLGAFKSEKQLAQVWLALWRGEVRAAPEFIAPDTPFGVSITVRPPRGRTPVWGGLIKGIVDGVTCAFQSQSRPPMPQVVDHLAKSLAAQPEEIEKYLLDESRGVLGCAERLVSPYGSGVKWDPSDHWCVAGEVLGAEPCTESWAISGEIFELGKR